MELNYPNSSGCTVYNLVTLYRQTPFRVVGSKFISVRINSTLGTGNPTHRKLFGSCKIQEYSRTTFYFL